MGNYTEDASQPYNFWVMDKDFKIIGRFGKIEPKIESRTRTSFRPFSTYNGQTNILSEFERYVMNLQDVETEAMITYFPDFGSYNWPDVPDKTFRNDEEMFRLSNTYISYPDMFQETDKDLIWYVIKQGQPHLLVYDKERKAARSYVLSRYVGDLLMSFGQVTGMNQKEILTIHDAARLYDVWKGHNQYNDFEKLYPKQVRNLRRQISKIDPEGNPFLVIYQIR